ncbi:NeuD/PglB/VioB family sugar acetyltransferase [Eisenibacter elegans]|uniref:NeuD/PglB/VioB family sugar acetyltransferase n=1 Tax=Eisenibacter elegans TaxID=997 RepID=UPI000413AF62|nr:NeuD/PglB/VioB family sugar acetyltransferase [Eisenibacter elegans]
MMKEWLFFPAGANAIEALTCLGAQDRLLGFVDDAADKQSSPLLGYPVWGREALEIYPQAQVLAVQASPNSFRQRQKIVESLAIPPARYGTLIHPTAQVSPHSHIGHNCLLMAGVVIMPGVHLGNHIIVLPYTVLHHDVLVEDYTWIGSHCVVAGGVRLGRQVWLGSGSRILQNRTIGADAMIGLGSNVIDDMPQGATVAGNPAKGL